MSLLTWRSLALSVVAALALVAGLPNSTQACCFSWLWGGGGWGAAYPPYYAGYSSYGSGGGCSSCGYASSCCTSCGPSCGYGGCSSCGPACGSGGCSTGYYGASTYGCSTCSGGGCGVTYPSTNSARPTPDDGFLPGKGTGTTPSTTNPPRPAEESGSSAAPRNSRATSTTDNPDAFPEGGTSTDEPALEPRTKLGEPFKAKKTPVTSEADADSAKTKTNRPVLGSPQGSEPEVIPQKKPAPVEAAPEPELPAIIELDGEPVTEAVAPKSRMALTGRFGTPSMVRLAVRPMPQWIAAPQTPVLAKH